MERQITPAMAKYAARELAMNEFDMEFRIVTKELIEIGDNLIKRKFPNSVLEPAYRVFYNDPYKGYCIGILDEENTNWIKIPTSVRMPNGKGAIVVSNEEYEKIKGLHDEIGDLMDEKLVYCRKVANALLELKTEQQIRKHFPEALQYLDFGEL